MALVLWLLMALVPFVLGKGVLRILYGNQPTQKLGLADSMLTGGIVVIGLAEAAHLGACLLGRSFSDCVKLLGIGVVVCLLAAVVVQLIGSHRDKKNPVLQREMQRKHVKRQLTVNYTKAQVIVYVIFGIIVLVQFLTVVAAQSVYLGGDMTLETVNSFLATDTIYQVNPMTGKPYSLGIPMRLKILCLPTFYAILCQSFGLEAATVVLSIVPAFVLLLSYLAFSAVAGVLFPEDAFKRGLFLVLTALLVGVGDYMVGMDGFGLMHSGFRGVTIRGAVLIPYALGLVLRRRYKLAVLCILAEACIVWTLYGMGACLVVVTGVLLIRFVIEWLEKRKGRKEGAICKNS